jgi:hypothetical protein
MKNVREDVFSWRESNFEKKNSKKLVHLSHWFEKKKIYQIL